MTLDTHTSETIAAIATAVAAGHGGIAVIRISGPSAKEVGQTLVSTPGRQLWKTHSVIYGYIRDERKGKRIDEVLALLMEAPRSFTGEDVVEIHCHGGLIVVQQVFERVLAHPAIRRALPGEFSQRAVLNGRLNLTQAEAINDLIAAKSRQAAQLAITGMDGGIQNRISSLREILLNQLSELEARVDFEDELPPLDGRKLLNSIKDVRHKLNNLIADSKRSQCLRNGLNVAIIGRTNVGKSSMLNLLSRSNRAIVTNIPGTTRDLLESEVVLEGVPIKLIDTAGIRTTDNEIEKLGIIRTKKVLCGADVIIFVFDINQGWTENDELLLSTIPEESPRIIVGNKVDIASQLNINSRKKMVSNCIKFSAHTGQGEQALIEMILKKCGSSGVQSVIIALNERQRDLAEKAEQALIHMQGAADQKLPWDFWTIDLRQAIHYLGEVTGEEVTEAVLDRIFSQFCIGK